jgi:hypothetical protein
VTTLDPKLLEQITTSPFMTVEAGDTVIMCLSADWGDPGHEESPSAADTLGTYLQEWNPKVKWQAIVDPGFAGVIHVKATASTTE